MSRMYTLQFSGAASTATSDFFEIVAPTNRVVRIWSMVLSQKTEVGDAEEEQLLIQIKSGQTTTGNGTTTTAVPTSFGDTAYAGTCKVNSATKATGGTIVTHHSENWNVRGPGNFFWTPETTLWLPPSRRFTVEQSSTPNDSITFAGTIYFESIG